MSRPNFFILGAPRCGTTALAAYLAAHPRVFVSPYKEPHYFAADLPRHRAFADLESYLRLFEDAEPRHAAIGEASVFYLYSAAAVGAIRAFDDRARVIFLVRNPVDLCHSLHRHLQWSFYETESDFAAAWSLSAARGAGQRVPRTCPEPVLLNYERVCRLGEQAARVYATLPPEQILPIVFDDFARDPGAVYRTILRFLEVPDDGRREFPVVNASRVHRVRWVGRLVDSSTPANRLLTRLKRRLRVPSLGLASAIQGRNTTRSSREPPAPAMRATLRAAFRSDVERLAEILDRDLTHWLR